MRNSELQIQLQEITQKLTILRNSDEMLLSLQGVLIQIEGKWQSCDPEGRMLMHPLSGFISGTIELDLIKSIGSMFKSRPMNLEEVFSFLAFKDSMYMICKKIIAIRRTRECSLTISSPHETANLRYYSVAFLECSEIQKNYPGIFDGDHIHYLRIFLLFCQESISDSDFAILSRARINLSVPVDTMLSSRELEIYEDLKQKLLVRLKDSLESNSKLLKYVEDLNEFAALRLEDQSVYSRELRQRILIFLCECAYLTVSELFQEKSQDTSSDVSKRRVYG